MLDHLRHCMNWTLILKHRNVMKFILVFSILFVSSCAWNKSFGPVFAHHEIINKDETLLYLYAPVKNRALTGCTMITIDGVDEVCFGNPGYGKVVLSPGQHSLRFRQKAAIDINPKSPLVDYNFKPGQVYYFRYKLKQKDELPENILRSDSFPWGYSLGTIIWQEVDSETALAELRELTLWR